MLTGDDIGAYLERLRLGAEPPSVDALFRLHRAQVERVCYETTWIHMGERWDVDRLESLRRIAHHQRGGYCFHLNGAFSLLLEHLGYDVTLHVGRVHGPDGPDPTAMANHLVVEVHGLPTDDHPAGSWYIDAGLGDALHEPLPLTTGTFRQGPFEYVLASSGDWRFQHDRRGSFPGMAFEAQPGAIDDFAGPNVHLSTSPDSGFVQTVTVQRRDELGADILRGQVLRRVESTVVAERTLSTRREWFDAIADVFDLPLTGIDDGAADRLWASVHASHERWLADQAS